MEKGMDIEIEKKFFQVERTHSTANNVPRKPESVIAALQYMLQEGMPVDSKVFFYDDISDHSLVRISGSHRVEEEIPNPQLELLPEVS
jgi:hypothetical protein